MTKLGKYEVREVLGRGGFGTVYRAVDLTLDREVALKVLHPQWAMDSDFLERFQQTVSLMAKSEHRNIVVIYEMGEIEGQFYIAMRYMSGGSLADRLKVGCLELEEIQKIMSEVCAGVQELHRQGWVHRDLKPENILFDAAGQAVVADFGLAQTMDESSLGRSSSIGGVGAPFYRAPELWNGKPPASPATDVYSLGCILGEMLTGQPLFDGDTLAEIVTRHLVHGPDYGETWSMVGAFAGIRGVLDKALQRDAEQRYADAESFARALDDLNFALKAEKRSLSFMPVPQAGDTMVRDKDGMTMVYVPAGLFEMGSNNGWDKEKPVHIVYLDGYWIDKYAVSNAQFRKFVDASGYKTDAEKDGSGWVWTGIAWEAKPGADWMHPTGEGSSLSGKEDHPVVQVSWNDAQAYCAWVGERLPTEAEWEKAARGTDGRTYPWGNAIDKYHANYNGRGTTKVGSYPRGASPYGALDMAGNVWEWTEDWFGYYSGEEVRNPTGQETGNFRVVRGGSWRSPIEDYLRVSTRYWFNPDSRDCNNGFRCVRSQG